MKWEYKTVKLPLIEDSSDFELTETDKFINQFGQENWELVSTQGIISYNLGGYPSTKVIILFFKRPLAD